MSLRIDEALTELGRPIIFYPNLARVFGRNEALFLQQMFYWLGHCDDRGWIYKTADEWEDETSLTKNEQRTVRRNLVESGILREHHDRLNHRMFFRIEVFRLREVYNQNRQCKKRISRSLPDRLREVYPIDFGKSTESTSYIETEMTTEKTTEKITPIPPEGATTATTENHSQQDSPEDQSTDDIPIWEKFQDDQVEAQEKPADPPKVPKPDSITPQMINRFVEIWNEHAAKNGWRTSRALSESRKRAIRARLKDKIFNDNFIAALKHMAKDRFFSGSNDRQWVANIDYFLQPKSFDKLIDRMGGDGNIGAKAGPPKWKDALLFICREHPDEVERYKGIENCESFDDLPPDIAIKVNGVITYGSIYGGGSL